MNTALSIKTSATAKPQNRTTAKKGIALLVAIGTMVVILIVATLGIYLITRGLNITSGQQRYQSALEACEGGVELGLAEVNRAFLNRDDPDTIDVDVGRYTVQVISDGLFATTSDGDVLKFGRGYFGIGYAMQKGGVNFYYRIRSQAVGGGGERITIELLQKKKLM
jgi:hypothetical protein